MLRRLLYWLGIIDLVWTIDFDDVVRLRTVWYQDGRPCVFAICAPPLFWNIVRRGRFLSPDGTFTDGSHNSYMKKWVHFSKGRPFTKHQWIHPFRPIGVPNDSIR